jgi:hypothetical protein
VAAARSKVQQAGDCHDGNHQGFNFLHEKIRPFMT